jgi:hypothetical protein
MTRFEQLQSYVDDCVNTAIKTGDAYDIELAKLAKNELKDWCNKHTIEEAERIVKE